jgi:hypothetical protein
MPSAYYRLSPALVASLSLMLVACAHDPSQMAAIAGPPKPGVERRADPMDTGATIWTLLGIAKKRPPPNSGPHLGGTVSPVLWKATLDTLDFVKIASEDPLTGVLATEWYSPKNKPDERFKVAVYILSRALLSSSLVVRVQRQTRSPQGQWADAPVDEKVNADLEAAILDQARRIWHAHIVKEL